MKKTLFIFGILFSVFGTVANADVRVIGAGRDNHNGECTEKTSGNLFLFSFDGDDYKISMEIRGSKIAIHRTVNIGICARTQDVYDVLPINGPSGVDLIALLKKPWYLYRQDSWTPYQVTGFMEESATLSFEMMDMFDAKEMNKLNKGENLIKKIYLLDVSHNNPGCPDGTAPSCPIFAGSPDKWIEVTYQINLSKGIQVLGFQR